MNVDDGLPSIKTRRHARSISPTRLFRQLTGGRHVVLLDVREPAEVARAGRSIPGSTAIPMHQLFLRRSELPSDKTTPLVAISTVEERAHAAAFTLAMLGYTDIHVLEGGIEAWAKNALPLA